MSIPQNLRKRINFQSEFDELLLDVSKDYGLGEFSSFEVIESGHEDVNLKLLTSKGNFFVKIFAEKRDDPECLRLINVIKSAIDQNVPHPVFLKKSSGYIFRGRYDDFNVRLAVFEYIDGKTFFELKRNPTTTELKEIIKFASYIHQIDYKPPQLHDSEAFVNFGAALKKSQKFLLPNDLNAMEKLLKEFEKVDLNSLPHAFVHGDLTSTNIIKTKDRIFFVDFSVANYYPRIVELAVLMSDIMFDPTDKIPVKKYFTLLVSEYQKHAKLSQMELETLPLFIKLAHAMHFIRATREKAKGNESPENNYWLNLGNKGLKFAKF